MLWRSAVNALSSTSRRASETHAGGPDPHAAGINRRWSGSIHLHRTSNPNQLHLQWLLEQQQGRHLSCQRGDDTADLDEGLALGDQLLGSLELADDLLRVCLVRFMVESPAQSGRMRTLIHPGLIAGAYVNINKDLLYRQKSGGQSEPLPRTVLIRFKKYYFDRTSSTIRKDLAPNGEKNGEVV